ncbi:MAG: twin-arginine translocase subunit TatB [Burkholderiales bacterium]|nr:twin-arginine translocase subunit TatB [Burkholderiales bacterium]
MFDFGFSELMVIAVVALIVIGPERLPKVTRTLGHLLGRMQRYVSDVKADISREIDLEELRKLQSSARDAARTFEQSVHRGVNQTETEFKGIAEDARPDVGSMAREPLDPGVSNAAQLDLSLGASEAPNNSPPQTDATQPVRR